MARLLQCAPLGSAPLSARPVAQGHFMGQRHHLGPMRDDWKGAVKGLRGLRGPLSTATVVVVVVVVVVCRRFVRPKRRHNQLQRQESSTLLEAAPKVTPGASSMLACLPLRPLCFARTHPCLVHLSLFAPPLNRGYRTLLCPFATCCVWDSLGKAA